MKFKRSDLDQEFLYTRAYAEAEKIFAKETTRRGRSVDEIVTTCMYGHAAEVYLMSLGYIDDTRPYKDLFEPDNTSIEVKVTEHIGNVSYVLDRCKKCILEEKWRKHPTRVYVWINDKKSDEYTLHGIYDWNGRGWIKK